MGIRGLTANLEPFTSSLQFGLDSSPGKRSAAIDGPGLAYHAFAMSVDRASQLHIPSYHEVIACVSQWLSQLESHGVEIAKIFFDGFLPASKKAERLSRLQGSLRTLIKFKAQYGGGVSRYTGTTYSSSARLIPSPARLGPLCSPFLVPAVLEALLASDFSDRVQVVPGEADGWCAEHARTFGSTVFTSDSDLLIHDIGPQGMVIFFKDLCLAPSSSSLCSTLQAKVYQPRDIADRLKLKGLLPLAYAIVQDPSRSFNASLQAARACDIRSEEYAEFVTLYQCTPTTPAFAANFDQSIQHICERGLDPRISEFVLQYDMYLPFLVEDPDRSSAWNQGDGIRLLGYSVIMPNKALTFRVFETFRRGHAVTEKEREVYSTEEAIAECIQLTTSLQQWISEHDHLPDSQVWRLFAMHSVLSGLSHNQISSSAANCGIQNLIRGDADGKDWDFLHFYAQFQAFLYSIRILSQITTIFLAVAKSSGRDRDLINVVLELHQVLNNLPPVHELFPPVRHEEPKKKDNMLQAITRMYASLGVEETNIFTSDTKAKERKRKAKGQKDDPKLQRTQPKKTLNLYSILSES